MDYYLLILFVKNVEENYIHFSMITQYNRERERELEYHGQRISFSILTGLRSRNPGFLRLYLKSIN